MREPLSLASADINFLHSFIRVLPSSLSTHYYSFSFGRGRVSLSRSHSRPRASRMVAMCEAATFSLIHSLI